MSLVQTKYFPFKKRSPELGLPDDTTRTDVLTPNTSFNFKLHELIMFMANQIFHSVCKSNK
jgi:hypothetical protein